MKCHRWRLIVVTAVLFSFTGAAFATDSPQLAAVKACRQSITNRGKTYAKKRRSALLSCIDRLLKCELKREIGDAPSTFNYGTCRSGALSACTSRLGNQATSSLSLAKASFINGAGTACTAALGVGMFASSPIMSSGSGGLWFSNDTTCGTKGDLPTLLNCLEGEMNARVDAVVSRVKPRGGLLLDNAGFGADFPNLFRPTTVPAHVTSASNGSPLDPLGTISVGPGDSVTIDATSAVGCGSGMGQGNNGHLTISVGPADTFTCSSGTPSQQFTLKEPYGPGDVALLGPFNVDQNYCIDRKDGGGCMDSISGLIDVTPDGTEPATGSLTTLACQTRFDMRVRTLASYVATKTHTCTEKVVRCKLAQEIDSVTPSTCPSGIASACNGVPVAITNKLTAMKDGFSRLGIPKKCSLVSWDSLTAFVGGLGFLKVASDAACGVGDLSCLMDTVLGTPTGTLGTKCDVEHKVFIRDPRALDSLMSVSSGFEGNFPCVGP